MKEFNFLIFCFLYTITLSGQELIDIKQLIDEGQYNRALSELENTRLDDPTKLSVRGEINLRLQRLDIAEQELLQAITLLSAEHNPDLYSQTLNRLALVYLNSGRYTDSEKYMLVAIDVRKKYMSDNKELLAASHNDLGLILSNTSIESALNEYEKALDMYIEIYGRSSLKVAQALINIGYLYRQLDLYGDAMNNFAEAKKIIENNHPDSKQTLGFIISNEGITYKEMLITSQAKKSFDEALTIYKKIYGDRHPEIANIYNFIAQLQLSNGEYEDALNHCQKALIANTKSFSDTITSAYPKPNDYYHPNTLLVTLLNKSKAFQGIHFNRSLKFKHLKESLKALQFADSILTDFQNSVNNESDKLLVSEIGAEIYEAALRLSFLMGERAFKKKDYFDLAYYYNSKSKATVLQNAIKDSRARTYAGIPDQLLESEKELRSNISFLRLQLQDRPEEEKEQKIRVELIAKEQNYRELVRKLEQDYPKYYSLKYDNEQLKINEIQHKLQQDDLLISYFISESSNELYIFSISKDKFRIEKNNIDDNFSRFIAGMKNGIYFRDLNTFKIASEGLSKYILPAFPGRIKNLIIIPSGPLSTIPYEALLVSKSNGPDYSDLSYLINEYHISYAYSDKLFFDSRSAEKNAENLIMAPIEFESLNLPALPSSEDECLKIGSRLKERNILSIGNQATEDFFKESSSKKYRFVHLATHGFINPREPDLSCVFFTPDKEDGLLFTGEIYNMELKTNLITLSACETGLGKFSKGEGVLGFTRALLYAGADNIIVSLWSVQDNSTAQFMIDFYDGIGDDISYRYSLQDAKKKMIASNEFSDPYFWAPFILIGQ